MECTARRGYTVILSFLLLIAHGMAVHATDEAAAVAEMLPLEGELEWNLETDVGTLHFYAADTLWSVDMMRGGKRMTDPIALPGVEDPRDVWHIPQTALLLVTRARDCGKPVTSEGENIGEPISCLIDLFSGEVRWRQAALPTPDRIYSFATDRIVVLRTIPGHVDNTRRAGKEPSQFTAVELVDGARLWSAELVAQTTRTHGRALEVLGARTMTLDARSGKPIDVVDLPISEGTLLSSYPEQHRILTWKKKQFALFEIPALANESAPGSDGYRQVEARRLWETTTAKSLGEISDAPNLHVGPTLLTNDRILINSLTYVELLDATSGKSLWGLKKKMSAVGQDVAVSPSGAFGAEMVGKSLRIIDLGTGSDYAEIEMPGAHMLESLLTTPNSRILWQNDRELIFVLHDMGWRPLAICRVDVPGKSVIWNTVLPPAATFRMTSKEKGKAAGRVFLALALTGASMANPVVTGNYATYYIFVPNLGVKVPLPSASAPGTASASVPTSDQPNASLAMERYRQREQMIAATLGKSGLFVSGNDDRYRINRFDMTTGRVSLVARYEAPAVNAIEPDIVYGLAVAQEQNNRVIRVLGAGSTFHADDLP